MTKYRILVISALLASLGPLVGNGLWAGPGTDGDQILADARDGLPAKALIAIPLEVIGFGAMTVLFAWLAVHLARSAPVAAGVTAIAGAAMIAVKVGSAAPMMVVHAIPEKLDPRTAEALISMNDQSFVVSGYLTCVAFLAAGLGLLRTDFPRWLALWAAIAGGLGVLAGIVGITDPDAFVPIPFLLCLLWMIVTAITFVMRTEDQAVAPNRTRAAAAATE